jgi:hypothetical protein
VRQCGIMLKKFLRNISRPKNLTLNSFYPDMKRIFIISLLIPLFFNSCLHKKESNPGSKKNLLIIADEWPQMDVLEDRLNKLDYYVIKKVEQDQIDSDLSGFDFVFMYVHKTLISNTENALINFTNNGGSLIVLHHGIASAKMDNPKWLHFLGVELFPRDHEKYPWGVLSETTHTMVNLNPGHFITSKGIKYEKIISFDSEYDTVYKGKYNAFDLLSTEIFINQQFIGDQHQILFGFSNEDGSRMQPTSGWYKQAGKGRIFYYQAGHSESDYEDPNFFRILLNTLEWTPETIGNK